MNSNFVFVLYILVFPSVHQAQGSSEKLRAKDSTKSIPEEDFEKFLELQTALFRSNRLDQEVVNSTLESHLELISNLNQAMGFLLDKIDHLQKELEDLKNSTANSFNMTNANVRSINNTIAEVGERLEQTDSKADDALEKHKTCITDIRFGAKELALTFKGTGHNDEKSFVMTGNWNHNSDEYIDHSYRRRFEIFRSGNWTDPIWE